jgi:hypothetical protein
MRREVYVWRAAIGELTVPSDGIDIWRVPTSSPHLTAHTQQHGLGRLRVCSWQQCPGRAMLWAFKACQWAHKVGVEPYSGGLRPCMRVRWLHTFTRHVG